MMVAAASRDEMDLVAHGNIEFHRILRTAAGNPFLDRVMVQIEWTVRRLKHVTFEVPGRAQEMLEEHRVIIEAIATQDIEAAVAAAQTHMAKARDARIKLLLSGHG
jgi:DNA-binding GntR family transcriptional regulator